MLTVQMKTTNAKGVQTERTRERPFIVVDSETGVQYGMERYKTFGAAQHEADRGNDLRTWNRENRMK